MRTAPVIGLLLLAAALLLSASSALTDSEAARVPGLSAIAHVAREIPVINLPRALREWNWGGGSCVHASTVMELRWCNNLAVARWWRETNSGGESFSGLTGKLRHAKIPYYATSSGDTRVLERCIRERRGAIIFYYPNHSILLVHLDRQRAIVLDNNRIDQYVEIPRDEFLARWRGYGGVAVVPVLGAPAPPLPWLKQ